MTGGTRKRGSTWSYYFDLGKVSGKRQKKEKGGFKTKKEAEAALAKAINEYNSAGAVFEPSEITVSDYLDQWFIRSLKSSKRREAVALCIARKTTIFLYSSAFKSGLALGVTGGVVANGWQFHPTTNPT